MKELLQDHPSLSHLDQEYKKIAYDYDLVSGNVNEVQYEPGKIDQFYHKYEYDGDNRITNAWTSPDGVTWDQDAKYFYYRHGPLKRTELTNDKAQGIDHAYTLHGWIKAVNSNSLKETHDIGQDGNTAGHLNTYVGRDEYGYSLGYYGGSNGDYTPIVSGSALGSLSGSGLEAEGLSLFNGNIRHMVTSIRQFMSGGTTSPQAMAYRYDQLNRIVKADMFNNMDMSTTYAWGASGIQTDYQERYKYDGNGNILELKRNGVSTQMDDLDYTYASGTNRLTHVDDAASSGNYTDDIDDQSINNYDYDEIGNLVKDAAEYIDPSYTGSGIEWNVYGKISKVTRTTQSHSMSDLEFKYDAMGNRIMKLVKPRTAGVLSNQKDWTYTYYVRDAQGNVMATYQRAFATDGSSYYTDGIEHGESHVYGSSRIGVRNSDTGIKTRKYSYSGFNADGSFIAGSTIDNPSPATPPAIKARVLGKKQYELTNHLGNVLVTVTDRRIPMDVGSNGTIDYFSAKVTSANDYTPFGSLMTSRGYNSPDYRYGFNGKENDPEVVSTGQGTQDYGMRIYNPALGRFLSVDPLAPEYPWYTPYQFAGNTPIQAIDLDGLEPSYVNPINDLEIPASDRLYNGNPGATDSYQSGIADLNRGPGGPRASVLDAFTIKATVGLQFGVEAKVLGKQALSLRGNAASKDLIGLDAGKFVYLGQDNAPTYQGGAIGLAGFGLSGDSKLTEGVSKKTLTPYGSVNTTQTITLEEKNQVSWGLVSYGKTKTTTQVLTNGRAGAKSSTTNSGLTIGIPTSYEQSTDAKFGVKAHAIIGIEAEVDFLKLLEGIENDFIR